MQWSIRPMCHADLERVVEIERRAQPAPWTRQIFIEELARPLARIVVLCVGDLPVAFCNTWFVADEAHVLNVATHPDARRRGHAERLLRHVIDAARGQGARRVLLEVRRHNPDAIRLYRRLGFLPIAIRPGYYVDDGADAVVMSCDLDAPGAASMVDPALPRPSLEDSP